MKAPQPHSISMLISVAGMFPEVVNHRGRNIYIHPLSIISTNIVKHEHGQKCQNNISTRQVVSVYQNWPLHYTTR